MFSVCSTYDVSHSGLSKQTVQHLHLPLRVGNPVPAEREKEDRGVGVQGGWPTELGAGLVQRRRRY